MAALQWLALLALVMLLDPCTARMQGPPGNPLIDDSVRGHHKPNSRSAECVFGKQTRELGSTWFADLGPPFGVMYCIRCECVPIQKKRRIVARVQCRNIKHECPEPTCDEPVLLPNRCCKVCPGDVGLQSPDVVQDVAPTVSAEEEDKNWKHFAALLTGRTSRLLAHAAQGSGLVAPPRNAAGHVATARFTFHRKSLYYSVLTPRRPRAIQFVDREGSILEEQAVPAQGSAYQNATGKVCGVWRRLSRDYRRLLREERLLVTLLWDNEDSVTGAVQRARSLGSELLSALLLPVHGNNSPANEPQNPLAGAGGTAIVSISSSGPSVHVALLFNGIFSPQDILDVPVNVRLETADGSRQVLEETVRVAKPGAELNEASVTAAVSAADLRLLTRGKLILTVASASPRRHRDLALAGAVQPRAVCEIFQAPLSVAEATADQQEDSGNGSVAVADQADQAVDSKDRPAGQAWLYVDRHGALVYSVQLSQVPGETTLLTLVSGRGRRSVELEDLTPSLHAPHGPHGSWGWANGSVSRLSPRELEQLYAGELSVNVATGAAASLVRGRLVARPVADARDAPQPTLLTPKLAPTGSSARIAVKGPAANLTGMAWFSIDPDCNLNYDVSLSPGSPTGTPSSPLQLALEQVPFLAPGAPVSRRVLDEFTTPQHEGTGIALTHAELSRLDAGVSYMDVVLPDGGAELRGELRQVRVPAFCLPHYSDNDVPSSSSMASAGQPGNGEPETLHCFHETRFYEDGAQWVSAQDACTMCSCHRARVQCDAVVCPPLNCAAPAPAAPGQCCGTCGPVQSADQVTAAAAAAPAGCKLGAQFHAAGTSWHPYVPPNGFDTCAVCTCNATTLEIRCERPQCPPLNCAEHEAVRPDPRACCKQCPAPKTAPAAAAAAGGAPPQLQAEQAAPKTTEEVLAEGGCKNPLGKPHSNGDEWHPRISSHGEYKCVKCRCKDGKVKCDRKRCTRSACEGQHAAHAAHAHQALRRSSAALHTPLHALHAPREDACCMAQCRRFRRHHNKAKTESRSEPRNEPRR